LTPLVAFTAAFASALVLARAALFHPLCFLLALPPALVLHFGWRHRTGGRLAAWALVGLSLGAGRWELARASLGPDHVALYNGAGEVVLTGVVVEVDRRPNHTHLSVDAETVALPGGEPRYVRGQVLAQAPAYVPARYGDRVQLLGRLEVPPELGDFSYREYLARQGVHSLLRDAQVTVLDSHQASRWLGALFAFRERALGRVHAILPEPQASLLAGILLGVETGIPGDLDEAFAATGTSHIVAISGFNLTLIAGLFAALAGRLLPRPFEGPVALGGMWLYTLLVGASSAVVRAAVMGSVVILARVAERRVHGPTSLAAAALAMSAFNPYVLWDVGFQLSLAATAGLVLLTDPLTELALRGTGRALGEKGAKRVVGWLSDAVIVTVAAQITTTPIIVAHFHRLSLVTLFTNALILPAQPFVMFFGGVALVLALILQPLGRIAGWVAWVFLTYTIALVRWTAGFPRASVPTGRVGPVLVWGYYLALAAGLGWAALPQVRRRRWLEALVRVPAWQLAAGGAVASLVVVFALSLPDGRLHVFFLDVGEGDAVFVQTPGGRQLLIDGGPHPPTTLSRVGERMPFWDRSLDAVVLTAPEGRRLDGLVPLLQRYEVGFVALAPMEGRGSVHERWTTLLAARPPGSVGRLRAGNRWQVEEGVELRVLWPDEEGPVVLQLVHGQTRVLLAGAATTVVEGELVARDAEALPSDVLLVPRQGAATACTPAFVEAVAPDAAVVSAGEEGPAPQLLARLLDCPLYRTDEDGTVEVVSDGRSFRVRVRAP
jgi:competence protein ComEC